MEGIEDKIKKAQEDSIEKTLLEIHRKGLQCNDFYSMYILVCQLQVLLQKHCGFDSSTLDNYHHIYY